MEGIPTFCSTLTNTFIISPSFIPIRFCFHSIPFLSFLKPTTNKSTSAFCVLPLFVMDAKAVQMLHLPVLTRPEKCVRITGCSLSRTGELKKLQTIRRKKVSMGVVCSYNNIPASTLESGGHKFPLEEELILKNRSQQILPYLSGRCIYVVGMMGSGKTTVGKIMSQALSYSFCDCDTLIEEEVDGNSVADIFKLYGESFFRDKETEALNKLSLMHKLVISTGGGAVVRPINWKYMHKGISVWLDVPVEALAKRIAAVGTNSRPLLHDEAGDAYTAALMRLSALFEERGEFYANANARVSLENIATKLGRKDASDLSPTVIAIEALEQIGNFLKAEDGGYAR